MVSFSWSLYNAHLLIDHWILKEAFPNQLKNLDWRFQIVCISHCLKTRMVFYFVMQFAAELQKVSEIDGSLTPGQSYSFRHGHSLSKRNLEKGDGLWKRRESLKEIKRISVSVTCTQKNQFQEISTKAYFHIASLLPLRGVSVYNYVT